VSRTLAVQEDRPHVAEDKDTRERDCPFCKEIALGESPDLAARYGPTFRHRAVWGTDEFLVIPSIGQLVFGHMLLVPRGHVNSLAACGERAAFAAGALLTRVESVLGPHVAFEHGTPCGAATGGCSIVHAHLHVLPARAEEWRLPATPSGEPWSEVEWLPWAAGVSHEPVTTDYLFIRLPGDKCFVSVEPSPPSQFLRQWAAKTLGQKRWDWREYVAESALPALAKWMMETLPPSGFSVRHATE
jgi:diadenosine tetraphosphate (Ap4A) HIT family hydrolase